MIASEVTDLPEPDSPTTARVSPRSTLNEMSFDACTKPSSVGKLTVRFLTSRKALMRHAPVGRCMHTRYPPTNS